MKAEYSSAVNEALEDATAAVRQAFFKQVSLLVRNLHHPSLRAKKYDESTHRWQARVNKNWRFYFEIVDDTYRILKLIPHPKK
jgi:plasmid maintenance system killer protein